MRLGDWSEMDGKKGAMISTTEIIAFRLLKEAGTEEFRKLSKLLKGFNPSTVEPFLDPLKQFSEEIGDEECVRKNQCPAGDSL